MTVGELIEHLKTLPPHLKALIPAQESGADEISPDEIEIVDVRPNLSKHYWDGDFRIVNTEEATTQAVLIGTECG
jgi:hypothetical protein